MSIVALLGCGGDTLAPRAPGARPIDEELPGDTAGPGPTFRTLSVNLADGVVGSPPARSQRLPDTATVAFAYGPAAGFENVIVQLDRKTVSTSGTISMVADHALAATADRKPRLRAEDLPLVMSARDLLTSSDVLGSWAAHRAEVDSLYGTVDAREARARLAAAYTEAFDPVADSTAMRGLMQALGGRTFNASIAGAGSVAQPAEAVHMGPTRTPTTDLASQAGTTLILFVNGLIGWPTEPARGESEIRRTVTQLGLTGVTVGHFYNDTPTRGPGFTSATCLTQASARTLVADSSRLLVTGAGFLQWPVLFGGCVPLADLDGGRQNVLDNLGHVPAPSDAAVVALAARIQQETAANASIVLVAHSQGSALVQRALQTLAASGPQTCVGVIALGSPSSAGRPVAGEEFEEVVVADDIVLDLGLNGSPVTETDIAAAVRDLTLLARTYVTDDVAEFAGGLFPHFFMESYLAGDATMAWLRSTIATQVATLQQRVACGG